MKFILFILVTVLLPCPAFAQDLLPINHLREPTPLRETDTAAESLDHNALSVFDQPQRIVFVPVIYNGAIEGSLRSIEDLKQGLKSDAQVPVIPNDSSDPTNSESYPVKQANWVDVSGSEEEPKNDPEPEKTTQSPDQGLAVLIEAKSEALKNDTQIDEATKSQRLKWLTNAQDWLQKGSRYREKVQEFSAGIEGFDAARKKVMDQLSA